MSNFTQENRHITITTPLGTDKLLVSSMQGSEAISRLFSYQLSLFSEDHTISFADIIGKGVTVSIRLPSGEFRHFNGIISSFSQETGVDVSGDETTRVAKYRATLVPKFWLLTRSAECRIFQNMTVPEIVEKVLTQYGVTDFELKLQGNFEKRDYCVQYRETHFNFISRLLEDEGIFYFFEHTADMHRLIVANSSQANSPCPGQKTASYQVEGSSPDDDTISSLEKIQEILPGKYALCDFNFETPNNSLHVNIPGQYKLGPGDREVYDYPGGYKQIAVGNKVVRTRMEEEESKITTVRGAGFCRAFTVGYKFTLLNAFRKDMDNKEFTLSSLSVSLTQSVQEGGDFRYENRFSCFPADISYRPARVTPKPVIQGTQTAIVVGPSGEEIHTDKYGRVKVQFHWDREGQSNDSSSCFIRVGQLWAGLNWGAMYIPRIGQEVIVDFLEGDPDRPIITGRVYHGINMPPYPLPDEKTKSTIKSCSTPGGGGFNELRFDDKKGEEQLFIHAEKQMDVRVKQDSLEWIGSERHLIVTKDQLEEVGGDKHLAVKGDQNEKVDGTVSLSTGGDLQQKVGGSFAVGAGGEIYLKGGVKVIIEGGAQLSLKAGGSFIDISSAGIFIQGAMVMINSGGCAGAGSGVSPALPKEPKEADKAESGKVSTIVPSSPGGPQAAALKQAAQSGAPFCCACC